MKKHIGFLSACFIAAIFSCNKSNTEPNYSIIPYIELRDFHYIKGDVYDTMKLTFYLRDGDFDLGLNPLDTAPPFNSFYFLDKTNGELIPDDAFSADSAILVTYKDRKTIDSLPSFNCSRWLANYNYDTDTLYYLKNQNQYNLLVNLFSKKNTEAWQYNNTDYYNSLGYKCTPDYLFDGRFPFLVNASRIDLPPSTISEFLRKKVCSLIL
ncbi:MAG: hypothetical protein QM734_17770 [Cyclobacteriaceae bacterium]